MSYCLVQFVEDGLYHVCPKSHLRYDKTELGLVSAKYKGIFFRAVFISEGEKSKMEELKERSICNDALKEKYKFKSPTPTATSTTHTTSSVKRRLFDHSSSDKSSSICSLKNVRVNVPEDNETQSVSEEITAKYISSSLSDDSDTPTLDKPKLGLDGEKHEKPSKKAKKYYCPFCRTLYKQFARHIFQVHKGDPQVGSINNFKKNHPERRRVIAVLRAKGARLFNSLKTSPYKLIIPRHKVNFNIEDYIQCYLCGNTYKKRFLHRHIKKCPMGDGSSRQAIKIAKQHSHKVEEESEDFIKFSEDVLSGMRGGDVKITIETDPVLRACGKYLCTYYGKGKHLVNLIRRKLRELAQLLIEIQKNDNEVLSFKDVFHARKKHVLFNAIRKVTGFEKGSFKRPAMANQFQALLKFVGRRLLVEAQEKDDEETEKSISRWLSVVNEDYNTYIGKHARTDLDEKKWNKPKTLPLTEDVLKLNIHVKQMTEKASLALQTEFSFPEWANLNKATLVKIMLFNRKRVGDMQRLTIDDFNKAHNVQKGTVTYDILSESEKVHCSKYKRIETRGKHGRGVPILLTKNMISNIKLLISLRQEANIKPENPYVFAKKGEEPFQATPTLKDMAYSCGASQPQLLTGTKLRQQIATATQAFNFSNNDLSILAKFLGHTLQTHSDFYRLPDEAIQLAKISVVLQAIDSGKIELLKGKSLKELELVVKNLMDEWDRDQDKDDEEPELRKPRTPKKKLIKIIRRTWTTPQKVAMRNCFGGHLDQQTLPTPFECHEAMNKYSPLKCRTVAQIKAWVNNQNKKVQRTGNVRDS